MVNGWIQLQQLCNGSRDEDKYLRICTDLVEIKGTEVGDIELNGSRVYRTNVRVCKRNQVRTPATYLDGYFKLDSPILVRVDNIGAIFMGENIPISQRTKHVDVSVGSKPLGSVGRPRSVLPPVRAPVSRSIQHRLASNRTEHQHHS
jgi:hypothetical protein